MCSVTPHAAFKRLTPMPRPPTLRGNSRDTVCEHQDSNWVNRRPPGEVDRPRLRGRLSIKRMWLQAAREVLVVV